MASFLRWGLLGTARINRAVIPPLKSSKRNLLSAVASRDPAKASSYAAEWNIPTAFGSYEEMLSSPEIDVVYISTPNNLHAEWTIKALRAGKHVLCEKPLTTRLADADAVIQAARETGGHVAEAFMYRHHPQTLKVEELLKSGAIGKVLLMHGAFTFNLTDPLNIRNNATLDGGSLWDIGCYPISYARTMAAASTVAGAEPLEAFGWQVIGESGVERTFSGELRFQGDLLAQVQSSFNTPGYARFEIYGDEGHLIISHPYKPERREDLLLVHHGVEQTIAVKSEELYVYEIEAMAETVLDGKPQRISLADSRGNTTAILALYESARTGKPVKI